MLTHRLDADLWVLPGGGVDAGESPWDAAIRETAEEVGLVAFVQRLLVVIWQPDVNEVIFDFLCTGDGEPRTCPTENDAVEWFAFDALPDRLFVPHRERLLTYLRAGWPEVVVTTTHTAAVDPA